MWTTKEVNEIVDYLKSYGYEVTSPPVKSNTARIGSGLYLIVRHATEKRDKILGICLADSRNPNHKQACVWVERPKGVGSLYWTDPNPNNACSLPMQIIDRCKISMKALEWRGI